MTTQFIIPLPDLDQWGTPVSKMPNCPGCGDDELGMMSGDHAVCCRCSAIIVRHLPNQSITGVAVYCGECPWMGTIGACEPGDDGKLRCPQCLEEISVRTPELPS